MKLENVVIAGGGGMVGGAIERALRRRGYGIDARAPIALERRDYDLCDQAAARAMFGELRPATLIIAAARVGGIVANSSEPAQFIAENLAIAHNLIDGAWRAGCERVLYLGSSCIYPRECAQPIREEYLLTGPLERTNEAYAIAKIAGVKLCEFYAQQYGAKFFSVMPCNLYGPRDRYDLVRAHVLPALIRRAHQAKLAHASELVVWGSGEPLREFLHVDDLAEACVHLLEHGVESGLWNAGSGEEISIRELAALVCQVVGFQGFLRFDRSKPDGTPRKVIDSTKLRATGWRPQLGLAGGIADAYADFLQRAEQFEPQTA